MTRADIALVVDGCLVALSNQGLVLPEDITGQIIEEAEKAGWSGRGETRDGNIVAAIAAGLAPLVAAERKRIDDIAAREQAKIDHAAMISAMVSKVVAALDPAEKR